jgi:CDP-paratose 2-epimerase
MSVAVITGSGGLVGSEAAVHFAGLGLDIVGVDNNMRAVFFGADGSTAWNVARLRRTLGRAYRHHDLDVRDTAVIDELFAELGSAVELVIHAAAQPSHDWAAREPLTDFGINATGTLNMLEATRRHCPEAVFIFTSTNKVYGDAPNTLPFEELPRRFEIQSDHTYAGGIREDMSIDRCLHSVFGASKVAADVMVQEYGRYFGMRTACFRGGTLTGPNHSASELHGFLGYVMRCAMTGRPYRVFGYQGKQVRDAIHSHDLVRAFECFFREPGCGEAYNIGGGRTSNCSVIEAIDLCEEISGEPMTWSYEAVHRVGDHIWWIGDNGKFMSQHPAWAIEYDVPRILKEIYIQNEERWHR